MKISLSAIGIFLSTVQAAQVSADTHSSIRGNSRRSDNRNGRRHLLNPGFECTLYVKTIEFEDGHNEETLSCELAPQTMVAMAAHDDQGNPISFPTGVSEIIDIEGVEKERMEQIGAISGATVMRLSEGYIEEGGHPVLVVPSEATVDIEKISDSDERHFRNRHRSRQRHRQLAKTTGNLKTLVLRVVDGSGTAPELSTAKLRDDLFTDSLSLKTQYKACSNGRIDIIERGIVDVKVKEIAQVTKVMYNGRPLELGNNSELEKQARKIASNRYAGGGDLSAKFDLVIYCLPPGTGRWIAYAYINGRDSVFNNKWCGMVSTQMHEVGHNLGLGHSGDDQDQYGDQSAMMGYSYFEDDGPKMCFNAAKNFQLGWYKNQEMSYNPLENPGSVKFVLTGVDNAVRGNSNKLVTLRLEEDGISDYYIGYNRASGINSGTSEAKNRVSIFKKGKGGALGYGKSIRVAALSSDEFYTVKQWNGTNYDVRIWVAGKVGGNIKDANIEISVLGLPPPTEAPISMTQQPDSPCAEENRFRLELGIDSFGLETSWELVESISKTLIGSATKDKYQAGQRYIEPFDTDGSDYYCLEESTCYDFIIFDDYGDGVCCTNGRDGFFRGILDGNVIFEGGEFDTSDRHTFCTSGDSATGSPTLARTKLPTLARTKSPTPAPTRSPTSSPTKSPTSSPTKHQTSDPTKSPTSAPKKKPTSAPTKSPSLAPVKQPVEINEMNNKECKDTSQPFRVKRKKRVCRWLRRNKNLIKRNCKRKSDRGDKLSDLCPKTCAKAGVETCWSVNIRDKNQQNKSGNRNSNVKRVRRKKLRKEVFGS
ncbi:unnamed protein product [Pseudo-nitzschia multistriata]|uniref:Peptidase M11 gametolysin domain-containing protein n=1 Tax=Pseudo-nitzschia multistriata TaxID=183589 RepID=A0A448Z9Z1_9STRA|nr:unnamed protein product [Pseudo-nitzschia multistriata]